MYLVQTSTKALLLVADGFWRIIVYVTLALCLIFVFMGLYQIPILVSQCKLTSISQVVLGA